MASARTTLLAALTLLVSPLLVVAGTAPAHAAVTVFPVPTSAADLGRITTAPDGSMWFLEEDANKVGRITTSGQIQEFALPPTDSSVEGPAKGMDVGPDGFGVGDDGARREPRPHLERRAGPEQLDFGLTASHRLRRRGARRCDGSRVGHDELRQILHRRR